jgi:hypothetical protein
VLQHIICGREVKTPMVILYSKSVKTVGTAHEKCYDTGGEISGIKSRPVVDTGGLSHAMKVTTANLTDRNWVLEALRARHTYQT